MQEIVLEWNEQGENIIIRESGNAHPKTSIRLKKGAWVSHLALAEATCVLATVYERKASEIATAVEMLLNHENLTIQDLGAELRLAFLSGYVRDFSRSVASACLHSFRKQAETLAQKNPAGRPAGERWDGVRR